MPVFVAVSTHSQTNCALRSDGLAVCWGYAFHEPLVERDVSEVVAGQNQACFRRGGSVECAPAPFDVRWSRHPDVPEGTFESIGTGLAISCGVRRDGAVDCWGWDKSFHGPQMPPIVDDAQTVRVTNNEACIVTRTARATCWSPIPASYRLTDLPDGEYLDATSGWGARCGVLVSGEITCTTQECNFVCGDDICRPGEPGGVERCQDYLGHDDDGPIRWMERVGPGPGGRFVRIAISGASLSMCGLRPSGELECWGQDYEDIRALAPTGERFIDVAVGAEHICAITSAGALMCWGDVTDDWGQARLAELP